MWLSPHSYSIMLMKQHSNKYLQSQKLQQTAWLLTEGIMMCCAVEFESLFLGCCFSFLHPSPYDCLGPQLGLCRCRITELLFVCPLFVCKHVLYSLAPGHWVFLLSCLSMQDQWQTIILNLDNWAFLNINTTINPLVLNFRLLVIDNAKGVPINLH